MPQYATQTTGNLWFSMPRILPPPGGIDRFAFLMMAHRGLLELRSGDGAPFLAAEATMGDRPAFAAAQASLHADWVPTFHSRTESHEADLTWLAPHDERGWMGRMILHNHGASATKAELRFVLRWGRTDVTIYDADPLIGHVRLVPDGWGGGIGLGWAAARTEFGIGVGCSDGGAMQLTAREAHSDQVLWQGDPSQGAPRAFPVGARIELEIRRTIELGPGERTIFELYMSAAPDTKAACLDARYLREQTFAKLFKATIRRLCAMNADLPAALADDPDLGPLLRRNRLFCYFYSLGRTLDTEEICPVTSRSSDYYVSAAYWDRDALLWSFPTILDMDREMAATMLTVAFGRQGRNIGIHSRLIDGAMCEPGFELDELCAPILALDRYVRTTGDWTMLSRINLDATLMRIRNTLQQRRHVHVALFSTDYLPTDDPAQLPYCVYDNVLVWAMAVALERIESFRDNVDAARWWGDLRDAVSSALWQHAVIEHNGQRLFAWSVDLEGRRRLYDEPPGSLALLPWLGFVAVEDEVFRATSAWIYSTANPHYFAEVNEIGCLHEPHPWVLALANSLLLPTRRENALALLRTVDMDDGIACEAINENTGQVETGRHFATCAGFLCHAAVEAARAQIATSYGELATDRDTSGAAAPGGRLS